MVESSHGRRKTRLFIIVNYQKIYSSIIDKARKESRSKSKTTYYEAHHILPECLGGQGRAEQWKTHPNIVLLTAREHFLCHWLLVRIYPGNQKLAYAFWAMCNLENQKQLRYVVSSRAYEESKQTVAVALKNRKGQNNPLYGIKRSKETIEKIKASRAANPYKHTQEAIAKMKESKKGVDYSYLKGRKLTKESVAKREATRKANGNRKVLTCPHCKTEGINFMKKWHFDNCKHKI